MIRIKVKTLAAGIALLLLLGLGVYVLLPGLLFKMEQYAAVLAYFPNSDEAAESLYWTVEKSVPDPSEDNLMFIFAKSISSSHGVKNTPEQLDEAEALLKRLLAEFPHSRHYALAKWKLAQISLAKKELDQAEQLFTEIAADKSNDNWNQREAEKYATLLSSRRPRAGEMPAITGKVLIGDRPAGEVYVVLHRKEDNTWITPPFGRYPMTITDQEGTFRLYDVPPDTYEIGVGIAAQDLNGYYLREADSDQIVVKGNQTTAYDVRFVPQVQVISPTNKEVISDERIRFTWAAYPGAASYKLNITALERDKDGNPRGTDTVGLNESWTGTSAEYSIAALRTYPRGFGKSGSSNETWLSSSGILGAVFPGGEFIWSVDAYDMTGKKISSSSGYYTSLASQVPFFSLAKAGQLKGDVLVLQGDYPAAIKAYEQEQDNPYALRALALMTMHGIAFDDRGDSGKALVYLKKIKDPLPYDYELMIQANEKLGNQAEADKLRAKLKSR